MSHASQRNLSIKVLQINLRHGRLATAAFAQTLLELDTDIALVQEPFATSLLADSPFLIPNLPDSYEALHRLNDNHHFGAAIVAKKSLKCRLLPDLSENHVAAALLELDGLSFVILSIYLRPSLPSLEVELLPILSRAFSLSTRLVIGADANAKNPIWNSPVSNLRGRELEALLARLPLNVCNLPIASLAFVPPATSFIDVTLVGNMVKVANWHFPDIPSLSDHPYIVFELARHGTRFGRPPRLFNSLPPLQSIDKEKFKTLLRAAFASSQLLRTDALLTSAGIDEAVCTLVDLITKCARSSRLPLPPHSTLGRMPWWDENLARLRRETRKSRKKWVNCAESEKVRFHEDFKLAKALYQRALRSAIEKEWVEFCTRTSDGELLESLKRLSGNQATISFPHQLSINDNLISEPSEILKELAHHFFPQPSASNAPFNAPACPATERSMSFCPPITDVEMKEALDALSSTAAPGLDGISPGLLSLAEPIIHTFLLKIMNDALLCSYYPSQWKHAKVKVIPKQSKDNYVLPGSFRPISIVSSLSKVFEKIILSRLSWFAKAYNWIHNHQHGFREAKSTETATHQLVSFVEDGFANGLTSAVAFIDFQSAFDKANHHAIITSLSKKGCPLYLVRIICSFLFNRKATLCHEMDSFSVNLYTGCPQGSVLSAFLWLVLVDDVLTLSCDFHFLSLAYADDVTLVAIHKDPATAVERLQIICDKVANWAKSVDLAINASKTHFVIFSRRRALPAAASLSIDGVSIQPTKEVQYLGFILDQRLSWNAHIQAKCLAAKKLFFLVKKCLSVTWGLSMSRLKKLYTSTIEPTLLYGCSIWCTAIDRAKSVSALRSTQRLMALIILRAFKATSTEACFALCGFLPLDLRIAELAAGRLLAIKSPFSPRAVCTIRKWLPNISLPTPCAVPSRFFSPLFPPWLRPSLLPLVVLPAEEYIPPLPQDSKTIRVYTDGSVIGGCTGYGLVVVNSAGPLASCRGKLPSECSIFQAEGQAILEALIFASNVVPSPSCIEILSDSRAALIASLSSDSVTSPFHEIRSTLMSMPCKTQLIWIASHRGHLGNEVADMLAKQGALGPGTHTDFLLPPLSSLRLAIRRSVWQTWAAQWANCSKAEVTRAFFPSIASTKPMANLDLPRQVVQILSGHCRLNSYLFRISCAPSSSCACGNADETVSHFLFDCHRFDAARSSFKDTSLRLCRMWPPPLASIIPRKPLFNAFITFILKSKRLDPYSLM